MDHFLWQGILKLRLIYNSCVLANLKSTLFTDQQIYIQHCIFTLKGTDETAFTSLELHPLCQKDEYPTKYFFKQFSNSFQIEWKEINLPAEIF